MFKLGERKGFQVIPIVFPANVTDMDIPAIEEALEGRTFISLQDYINNQKVSEFFLDRVHFTSYGISRLIKDKIDPFVKQNLAP